jgi:uncharacterized protein YacL
MLNSNSINDWFYLVPSATLVDFIVLILIKYAGKDPYFKINALDNWYKQFGIFAVISDITSLLIGIGASRYIYTSMRLNYIPYFFLILFCFQLLHDLFFYIFVILKMKKGQNEMIDVFKEYANENGFKILIADFFMLVLTMIFAYGLSSLPEDYTVSVFIVTLYAFCYILFTHSSYHTVSQSIL